MKKKSLGLVAFLLAIGFVTFSAFTKVQNTKKDLVVYKYAIYGSGDQDVYTNFTYQSSIPSECFDDETLCWFRVIDSNEDGTIQEEEFDASFDALDTNDDFSLDDQMEQSGILEKKQ